MAQGFVAHGPGVHAGLLVGEEFDSHFRAGPVRDEIQDIRAGLLRQDIAGEAMRRTSEDTARLTFMRASSVMIDADGI